MKKTLILLMVIGAFPLAAQWQINFKANLDTPVTNEITTAEVVSEIQSESDNIGGIGFELILGKLGLGSDINFNMDKDSNDQWWTHWKTNFFGSFHLFGAGSFLDPFVTLGIGSAGAVNISKGVDDSQVMLSGIGLSIFPMAQAGLALNMDGLHFGGKLSYTPGYSGVPAAPINEYPLEKMSFTIFAGFELGGDRLPWESQRSHVTIPARPMEPQAAETEVEVNLNENGVPAEIVIRIPEAAQVELTTEAQEETSLEEDYRERAREIVQEETSIFDIDLNFFEE